MEPSSEPRRRGTRIRRSRIGHGASPTALPLADARSTVEVKLAPFETLFAGRDDVYARRWAAQSGKTGWSPAEAARPWERRAAELTPVQAKAVDAMTQHPTGVLVAPPGEVRSWARKNGHPVPDRGRLRADIWAAWHAANQTCFGTQAERHGITDHGDVATHSDWRHHPNNSHCS